MTLFSGRRREFGFISVLTLIALSGLLVTAAPPEAKRLAVYSRSANYSLNVVDRNGREYVGLLEVLEPLGRVSSKGDSKKWKLRFNDREAEFKQNNSQARVRGHETDLGAGFLLENGRGLVPLASLTTLLPFFLDTPVLFHVNSRRLFINQPGTTYSAVLSSGTPPGLVLNFSAPVNPSISTEPGKLRMLFVRDPVVPSGPETTNFENRAISSANFEENNGAAELTVSGSVPLLASFSNNGRTITIAPAPSATAAVSPPQVSNPAGAAATPAPTTPTSAAVQGPAPMRRIFAVIDASHGGDERGAVLSDKAVEKDITLAFARRLREELQNRGVPALIIRDGDMTMTLDQRASMSNAARPALYVAFHATNSGTGVRVITATMPSAPASHPPFLPWEVAQTQWLPVSQSAATSVATALRKRFPTRLLPAPLRPLNNVTAPAIAIEVGPPSADLNDFNSLEYQRTIAVAVSDGMLAVRDRLEAAR
jgi:N-acetylmuramoyl-L-alanine amidase